MKNFAPFLPHAKLSISKFRFFNICDDDDYYYCDNDAVCFPLLDSMSTRVTSKISVGR